MDDTKVLFKTNSEVVKQFKATCAMVGIPMKEVLTQLMEKFITDKKIN